MTLLKAIESPLLSGALQIVQTLRSSHHEALFAGGVVRDLLLGRPISDIDVATSAHPDQVEALFPHTIPVGKQFGVVLVILNGISYEIATFRKDRAYTDGRHPNGVEFVGRREDALRRDFTVNALFLDPLTEEIIDYVEGQLDLERRIIRTVGTPAERFEEDKLRLLRAVRFACQLGFEIESDTFREMERRSTTVGQVSQERIRDEVIKILTGPSPASGLQLLFDTRLLHAVLPEAAAMSGVEQPPEFHPEGDVFEHTKLMLELSGGNLSASLALGILLHDVGKPPTFRVAERIRFDGHAEMGAEMAAAICRRLRISNDLTGQVVDLVKHHLRFIHVTDMRESTLKRFLRMENFEEHLALHRLDCLSSHRDLSNYTFSKQKLEEFGQEVIRPKPLLNGLDLISLGFKPGPVFSEILTGLEDRQLEGAITTKEEALEYVKSNWPPNTTH